MPAVRVTCHLRRPRLLTGLLVALAVGLAAPAVALAAPQSPAPSPGTLGAGLPADLTTLTPAQLAAAVDSARATLDDLTAQTKQSAAAEERADADADSARATIARLRPQVARFAAASYASGYTGGLAADPFAALAGGGGPDSLLERLATLHGVVAWQNAALATLARAERSAATDAVVARTAEQRLATAIGDADNLLNRLAAAQTYLARHGGGQGGVHSCVLDAGQLATAARAAGFRNGAGYAGEGLTYAVAVALAESSGDVGALNANTNHTLDRGAWQINSVHAQYSPAGLLHDPVYAARAAYALSGGGASFSAWSTFSTFHTVDARLTAAAAGVAHPEPLPACAPVTAAGGADVLVVGDSLTAAGKDDLTGQLGAYQRAVAVDAAAGRTLTAGVSAVARDVAALPANGTLVVALGGDDPVLTAAGGPAALTSAADQVVAAAGARRVLWVVPATAPGPALAALSAVSSAHPALQLLTPGTVRAAATASAEGNLYRAAVIADAVGTPAA